jgi:hypothetical protein
MQIIEKFVILNSSIKYMKTNIYWNSESQISQLFASDILNLIYKNYEDILIERDEDLKSIN